LIEQLYHNLVSMTKLTQEQFIKQGQVVPTKTSSGHVRLGSYVIIQKHDQYEIYNLNGQKLYDGICLPETAILVANALALGNVPNYQILTQDNRYGFAIFDQKNLSRLIKYANTPDRLKILEDKLEWAEHKARESRQYVQKQFENICSVF
jgi:hypothetical protein